MKRISLVAVASQNRMLRNELMQVFSEVLESGSYIQGSHAAAFEREFAASCGANHSVGVNSGTDALILGLQALRVPPGTEVIVPSLTFPATPMAVIATGCIPVFADVDETLNIDVRDVARALTDNTRAVIAVHWAGLMADMAPLRALCDSHNLALLEDAAQAHGAAYRGRTAGSLGDVGCFSFHPTKTLACIGDGGAVTTNHGNVAERLSLLKNFGRTGRESFALAGRNSRLDELQAGILRIKLRHLAETNARRAAVCERYNLELSGLVGIPVVPSGQTHAFHLYIIKVDGRDRVMAELDARGIETAPHYSVPCHKQPALSAFAYRALPSTDRLCDKLLSLPIDISADEQTSVIENLRAVLRKI